MAGATFCAATPVPNPRPTILVFDSGLGGLTVLEQVRHARPDAAYVYAADDAAFPYGALSEPALIARVLAVMERLLVRHAPDLVVIACNTASTLVLPSLRKRFVTPFVGVVPPIKPAAALSRSHVVSLLATPGTVARAYTRELIETHAGHCDVTLVGAPNLAPLAERAMAGEAVADAALLTEIAPCFVTREDGRRTDVICLSCTHYPLLLPRFEAIAPWPVQWVDPAPAIARRVVQLLGPVPLSEGAGEGQSAREGEARPVTIGAFTGGSGLTPALRQALSARAIARITVEAMPLGR